jgi:PAS domain S-box-containing protein
MNSFPQSIEQTLIHHLPDAVTFINPDLQIRFHNATFYRLFQYPKGGTVGISILDILHPDDHQRFTRWVNQSETPDNGLRVRYRTQQGAYVEMSMRCSVMWREGIKHGYLICSGEIKTEAPVFAGDTPFSDSVIASDLTERKKRERTYEKLASVAVHTDLAVVITDAEGIIEWVNAAFATITGYSREEAIGHTPGALLQGPLTDSQTIELMRRKRKAGEPFQVEALNYRKDRSHFWMSVSVTPVVGPNGRVSHFVGIEADITARKELQNQVTNQMSLLRAIQESMPDSIFSVNARYEYMSFNKAHQLIIKEMFGAEIKIGVSILDVLPPGKNRETIKAWLDEALHGMQFSAQNEVGVDPTQKRYFMISYNPIRNERSEVVGVAVFSREVTQKVRIAQERDRIFHELHLYKKILDRSAMISVIDQQGRILHVNQSASRTSGYSREELIGRSYRMLESGYHAPAFFEEMWATMLQGKVWRGEICYRTKGGKPFWVDTIINPLINKTGHVTQYLCLHYDITDLKLNEERLKRSEAALREAQTVAKMGNWEYNLRTEEIFWSDEMFKIYRLDPSKGIPPLDAIQKIYHPDDWPHYLRNSMDAISRGLPYSLDVRLLFADGETRYVNVICCPLFDESGQVYKIHGTLMDINDRKIIEEHLQHQNDELQKINAQLDRFVYSVSHDMRAPLASVLGLITIVQLEADVEKKNEYMGFMKKSIHKLDDFIRDIIDFSRNNRTEILKEKIDLNKLIEDIRQGIHYVAEADRIEWQVQIREEQPLVSDPKRISVILSNLLSNAVRYSDLNKAHPQILIQVRVTTQSAWLIVADNGLGIAAEHLDKIFNMFYRATDHKPGSGLGLYIVKETIEKLHGSIKVKSQVKKGTTFEVCIPNQLKEE